MRATTVILIFLLATSPGCNRASREKQSKALTSEAAQLIRHDTEVTKQWVDEFVKSFTPENRSKFPANRDFLKSHAAEIIRLLDESSRLNNGAADKYEQAAALSSNEKERKAYPLFATAFRKTSEANDILKLQMQIVFDEKVVDPKAFDEKFAQSWQLITQKQNERQQAIDEARRLVSW